MTAPEDESIIRQAVFAWRIATEGLVAMLRGFPGDLDRPSDCGDWTNRQLMAHLATGYVERLAALHSLLETGELPLYAEHIDSVNARAVAQLQDASKEEIVETMIAVRAEVEALLPQLRSRHLDAPWNESTLRQELTSLTDHDLLHAQQLRP